MRGHGVDDVFMRTSVPGYPPPLATHLSASDAAPVAERLAARSWPLPEGRAHAAVEALIRREVAWDPKMDQRVTQLIHR